MLFKIALIAFTKGIIIALYGVIADRLAQRRNQRLLQRQAHGE